MIQIKPYIKYRLMDIRQDPKYKYLRKDIRRTIRYIEGLEHEVTQSVKELPKTK